MPALQSEWNNNTDAGKILNYYFPGVGNNGTGKLTSELLSYRTKDFSKRILDGLHYSGEVELEKALYFYFSHIGHPGRHEFYQLASEKHFYQNGKTYELADFRFDYEMHKQAESIKAAIEKLKQVGGQHLLLNILAESQNDTTPSETAGANGLSRLVIEKDYRIFLPDYGNLEIIMTPLPKTVFLFFLLHPEGVMLKHLCDHREELLNIYKYLSYRETRRDEEQSIHELVDPTKNSINEKCSRIKEAFLRNFEERLAQNYYITGERGAEKGIRLNRDLVTWNVEKATLPTLNLSKSKKTSEEQEALTEELFNEGKIKLNEKDYREAIRLFTQVLTINNYHSNACEMRAIAFFDTADYLRAILDNDRAIELNSKVTVAYHNRADNRCAASYFMRGLIKMELKDFKGACQDWFTAKHLEGCELVVRYYSEKESTAGQLTFYNDPALYRGPVTDRSISWGEIILSPNHNFCPKCNRFAMAFIFVFQFD